MERPGAGPAVVIRRLGPGDASVLAGYPEAERFYEACGFHPGPEPAAYLELHV